MNETISHEHSGEVQIPMLQHFMNSSFKIVMLTMNIQNPETAHLLAEKIFQAQKFTSRRILVLASCDFSHFEDVETGFKQDQFLIDQILEMNTEEMFNKVKKHNISACGYGPIMTLIEYSKKVAKKPKIELLRRGHSGEISHSDKVVDYASFLCFE